MRQKYWLMIFVFLFIFGVILSNFFKNKFFIKGKPGNIVTGHLISANRKWVNARVSKLFDLASSDKILILKPMIVRSDRKGNIYVLDYGDMKVKKFDKDGKYVGELFKGKGRGPGELLNPTDLIVDDTEKIWVSDGSTGLITIYEGGNVYKTIRPQFVPFRILPLKDDKVVVWGTSGLFYLYDYNSKLLATFGENILPEAERFSILLQGYISTDGEFLYVSFYRLSYIGCLDLKNRGVRYLVRTIDDFPTPKPEHIEIGGIKVVKDPKDAPISSLGLNCIGDILYNHAGVLVNGNTVVDAYSSKIGSYLYSFQIPGHYHHGHFDGNRFYGISDTVISVWRVEILK